MTNHDQVEALATLSDRAGALLDSLDTEIQAIESSPFIAKPHPKLVEARKEAHEARLGAERASQMLRDIIPPDPEGGDGRPVLTAETETL